VWTKGSAIMAVPPTMRDSWLECPQQVLNKKVRITGLIKKYEGSTEIVVSDPNQIEIMK